MDINLGSLARGRTQADASCFRFLSSFSDHRLGVEAHRYIGSLRQIFQTAGQGSNTSGVPAEGRTSPLCTYLRRAPSRGPADLKVRRVLAPVSPLQALFNVPAKSVTIQTAMSLFLSRRTTGIAMDTCDVVSNTVPITAITQELFSNRNIELPSRGAQTVLAVHLPKCGHPSRVADSGAVSST